uniref:Uncharacterized protein n=1 Tax=Anguilla anguilla TaxID=7936 RepID=A0A0E9QF41_ANGAN
MVLFSQACFSPTSFFIFPTLRFPICSESRQSDHDTGNRGQHKLSEIHVLHQNRKKL